MASSHHRDYISSDTISGMGVQVFYKEESIFSCVDI